MTTCPYCHGEKRMTMILDPGCRVVIRDCQDCRGTGLVNDDVIRKGRNATLKDVADALGISIPDASKMELGRLEPSAAYLVPRVVRGGRRNTDDRDQ